MIGALDFDNRRPLVSYLPGGWEMIEYDYSNFDFVMQNHPGIALARNRVTGEYATWSFSDWRFHHRDGDRGVIFNHGHYFHDLSEAKSDYLARMGAV